MHDWWIIGLTSVLAFAALVQVAVMVWQTRIFREQREIFREQRDVMSKTLTAANQSAEAAINSVAALEKLERPFLMIEVRNLDQVWVVNKGRVPAQIVWINKCPLFTIRDREKLEEMPWDYNYGMNYYDNSSEVFNEPWIAAGDEKMLTFFDVSIVKELGEDTVKALNGGIKVLLFLSAIKYRGLVSGKVYESRWCFSWGGSNNGLYHSGPWPSYNLYT